MDFEKLTDRARGFLQEVVSGLGRHSVALFVGYALSPGCLAQRRHWAARAEQLSESEHAAHAELAALNSTLEARVQDQVDELARLGRMRRFLSPQIANVVVSEGDDELLRPHRRRIG